MSRVWSVGIDIGSDHTDSANERFLLPIYIFFYIYIKTDSIFCKH